jgi:hypothetical protein
MQIPQDSFGRIGMGEELVARQSERQASSGTLSVLPSRVAFAQRASQGLKREREHANPSKDELRSPWIPHRKLVSQDEPARGTPEQFGRETVSSTPPTGTVEVHRGALRICPAAGPEG